MFVLRGAIFFPLIVVLFGVLAETLNKFTTVGNSNVLLVAENKTFAAAEEYCEKLNASLIELSNTEEWKQARPVIAQV